MADLNSLQATDSVILVGAASSGAETNPVNASSQGDAFVKDVMNVTGAQGAIALSTTATEVKVGGSRLTGRKSVTIQPTNGNIYWGRTSGVTTTTGTLVFKNQMVAFAIDDLSTIYIIAAGSVDVRVTEG